MIIYEGRGILLSMVDVLLKCYLIFLECGFLIVISINNLLLIYKFKLIYIHLFISLFMLQVLKVNLPKNQSSL